MRHLPLIRSPRALKVELEAMRIRVEAKKNETLYKSTFDFANRIPLPNGISMGRSSGPSGGWTPSKRVRPESL